VYSPAALPGSVCGATSGWREVPGNLNRLLKKSIVGDFFVSCAELEAGKSVIFPLVPLKTVAVDRMQQISSASC
jgi:hypothetical protein